MLALSVFRCIIEASTDRAIEVGGYVSLTVNNSHISGSMYAVSCSSGDCHVTNSRLQAIWCFYARSCTVQHSTVISTHSNAQAIGAVRVQTLIIDSNYIIANKTSVPAVGASGCQSIQASFLFLSCWIINEWMNEWMNTYIYTPCFIKNIPLAFLLYLSQMLFNDSENWNKYSSVKWL